jgi:S1-C subfamily serine protease
MTLRFGLPLALLAALLASAACRSPAAPPVTAETRAAAAGPAYLGVIFVTDQGLPGVRVVQVLPDSPAERAGLRAGDTILRANGQFLAGGYTLRSMIDALTPGARLDLEVKRQNGHEANLSAELDRAPTGNLWENAQSLRARP